MIYSDFQGKQLSLLGFGLMRLPTAPDGTIDEKELEAMVDAAMARGVNYFDTAYPYQGGLSEVAIGKLLKKYPRSSWYLADKYPGHQILSTGYDPAAIFEAQLKKCEVDYFDFYLLHNVYENSMDVYLDPKWGILDYFKEQKRLGRIRHLGFSCHSKTAGLEQFLDACGEDMEFCQIQLNYLDWTLQDGAAKYELLTRRGIPVWVMEPVRGGKLASLSPENEAKLKSLRPDESIAAWAFRFLQTLPNVQMILSGMSNMAQMQDNVKTFSQNLPLTQAETALLLLFAEEMKGAVPCTACRYCCADCPTGLDIPDLIASYNDLCFTASMPTIMRLEFYPEEKKPSACIACGKCSRTCPQGIDVPAVMKDFADRITKLPSWIEICRQREAALNK